MAAVAAVEQKIVFKEAQVGSLPVQLQDATGQERLLLRQEMVALRQELAALQQQKTLLMQQQAADEEFAAVALTVQRRLPCATKYASYLCSGSGVKQAAVVVDRHHVATYYHKEHAQWDKGLEVEVSVNDADADQPRCIKGIVEYMHRQADLILLKVAEELAAPVLDAQLSPGQRYFVLGQSAQAQGDASSVSHGIVAATQPDVCSHVRGDMVAGVGDSGAGCFAVQTGRLIGMIVGTDHVAHKSVLVPGAVIAHALSLVTPVA